MKHSVAISEISLMGGLRCSMVAVMSRKINSSTSLSLKILTALIGSPTYLGFLNLTVLTKPSFFSKRQGMTLVLSMLHIHEVLKNIHAELVTLLRMELCPHDIAAPDRRSKLVPVMSCSK